MLLIKEKNIYLLEFSSTPPALLIMCDAVTMDVTMAIRFGCPAGAGQALRHRA
jgi:hypothetical protein